MSDYKEKYSQALKMLDEVEREGDESLNKVYLRMQAILSLLKGRHKNIDKAIASLPKNINSSKLPLDTLDRIADLLVSFPDDVAAANNSMEPIKALLDELETSDAWGGKARGLNKRVEKAKDDKSLALLIQDFAGEIKALSSVEAEGGSLSDGQFVGGYKETLFQLLSQLTADLTLSLDVVRTKEDLSKVKDLKGIEDVSKEVFTGFGKALYMKNKFILELSGLIETVAYQLEEFSLELRSDANGLTSTAKDRWRFTELVDGEVKDLSETVLKATSLETLKSVLNSRLQKLNSTVSDYVSIEAKRAKDAETDAKSLEVKLAKVESEVFKLKDSLEHARDEASVDPLTGVANRRAYDERIAVEMERWKRRKEPLVVAILDVDHFKQVNDNYGHPVGDKVLKTISQLLNKKIRESDFFGRIGGEEFAIIFSDSSLDNALVRLDKIRQSVGNCKFGSKGQRVVITMSAGCAEVKPSDSSESIYERADEALLAAKKNGRNQSLSERDLL